MICRSCGKSMVDEGRFCSHCGVQQQDLRYDQKSKTQIRFLDRVWKFIMFCLKLTFVFCAGLIILGVVISQFFTKDANQINSANRPAGDTLSVEVVSKPQDVSPEEIEKKRLARQKLEEEWAAQVKANKERKEREEREKQEQERIVKEKMEQEMLAKEQEQKLAKEQEEKLAKEQEEKLAKEKLDQERQEKERLSRESNKTKVMDFGHMLAAIDNITSAEMKKVTSLVKTGQIDQTELYAVAKKSIASLKSAKYVLFTTSLPEDLTMEVSNHLRDSKDAMDMVIHYRMRVSEALMEYLDDPKPSHAAKMKEYVDAIYPEQLKSAEALTKAGALVGITYNDLFPRGLGSHSSKNAHNNPFAGSDKPNKSGKGKSRKHEK